MQTLARSRIRTLLVAALIPSLVLMATSCDGDQLKKAAKASKDLANLTIAVEDAVKAVFLAGQISESAKNTMARALIVIAREGKTFNDVVIATQALAPNGKLPPDVFTRLSTQFDKVVQPFLDLATQLNLLGPNPNPKLVQTLAALRAAILIISAVFN